MRFAAECRAARGAWWRAVVVSCWCLAALHPVHGVASGAEDVQASPTATPAAAREVDFRVGTACYCASCAFEGQRELKKFPGVQKVRLSTKERRLTVVFREGEKPVSALALALARLDLGKDSVLEWPAPNAEQVAPLLAKVPGVAGAQPDAKKRRVLLTFAAQPAVTLAQLDAASRSLDTK